MNVNAAISALKKLSILLGISLFLSLGVCVFGPILPAILATGLILISIFFLFYIQSLS